MRIVGQTGWMMAVGLLAVAIAAIALPAWADENDVVRRPMPRSSLPKMHADYSMYHFVPRGDDVKIQPERNRLFFRKKTGQLDGYAELHGAVVFYYDAAGKPVHIQRLTPEELARIAQ